QMENIKEKLLLQLEDEDSVERGRHPRCPHGPTVLFYRASQTPSDGFYACAAHRNPTLCNFRMERRDWQADDATRCSAVRDYPKATRQSAADPTKQLEPLSQDEVHAQYFFDEQALSFLAAQIRSLQIDKVVCMGAPRLHFHLQRMPGVSSFLLDFDERFSSFLSAQQFCLYNMCNNFYFYSRAPFEQFLKCSSNERLLIVTDPPFGCRTELIAHTLRSLMRLHNRLNRLPVTPLPIFWVYPYYMANYIRQDMPELQMCDYKLNYSNHSRYTNVGASRRSYGSPVRLFTNVPLELLQLPPSEGYKYCGKCNRHTALENLHCERCGSCSSQNGQTYRHCRSCDLCVKPNYVHCANCRRCSQREGHSCALYQSKQRCWLCGQLGHIETSCKLLRQLKPAHRKAKDAACLICAGEDHRERECKLRGRYFKETQFMGETTIALR
ncbi:hypothetical protein KR222_003934, partial [Zaprionus bogoriensis]